MADILIEVQGQDAIAATEELLAIPGLTGTWETESEVEREGVLAPIATTVGLMGSNVSDLAWSRMYLTLGFLLN